MDKTAVNPAHPIRHALNTLAVLRVSGDDAQTFLQGQCTCDLNTLNAQNSSYGAFCNVKGRVISTFIILKQHKEYLLILPIELLTELQQRLQRYILRAKVQLVDAREDYKLFGFIPTQNFSAELPQQPLAVQQDAITILRLGAQSPRFLIIADANVTLPAQYEAGLVKTEADWQLLEIKAGMPWLCKMTSEEYIPQMLNLDQLGGVSFTKGCYTGQEIVARTHYLGKTKRALFTAVVESFSEIPVLNSPIINQETGDIVGNVLAVYLADQCCNMLIVLAIEVCQSPKLYLQDWPNLPLTVV